MAWKSKVRVIFDYGCIVIKLAVRFNDCFLRELGFGTFVSRRWHTSFEGFHVGKISWKGWVLRKRTEGTPGANVFVWYLRNICADRGALRVLKRERTTKLADHPICRDTCVYQMWRKRPRKFPRAPTAVLARRAYSTEFYRSICLTESVRNHRQRRFILSLFPLFSNRWNSSSPPVSTLRPVHVVRRIRRKNAIARCANRNEGTSLERIGRRTPWSWRGP